MSQQPVHARRLILFAGLTAIWLTGAAFRLRAEAELRAAAVARVPADHAGRMARGLQTFQKNVRPLLIEQCLKCHGGEKTKGGLVLVTRETLLQGGDDGPVVVPFSAGASRLLKLLRHDEEPH